MEDLVVDEVAELKLGQAGIGGEQEQEQECTWKFESAD